MMEAAEGRLSTADIARPQASQERPEDPSGGSARGIEERGLENAREPLLPADEGTALHERWDAIQVAFVDEPRASVEQADQLVAHLMQRLAAMFSDERASLESQWERGEDVSTEDLRMALQRYRSFFERLLSM
jgi:hypothetical protein